MRDKAFHIVARCARCGRAKNHHRASTLECPEGKRTRSGYLRFSDERFLEASREQQTGTALADVEDFSADKG